MPKDKQTGHTSFTEDMTNVHLPIIHATCTEVSDDRRKYVKGQAGNTLLFRSAASFRYFLENQAKRPSSLNEAITLRRASYTLFDDDEQFEANCNRIANSFLPKSPVIVVEDNTEKVETPDWLADDEKEVDSDQADVDAMLEKHQPLIAGFLNGAEYDEIDIPATEWMSDRARLSASKTMEAMRERCHKDVIFIGGKFKAAKEAHNDKLIKYWNAEGYIANLDRAVVKAAIKQNGYELDS
jgi:hypothetical protein